MAVSFTDDESNSSDHSNSFSNKDDRNYMAFTIVKWFREG